MNTRAQIKLEKGEHRQQQVVFVRFTYNTEITELLRTIFPLCWSRTKGCWYIPEKDFDSGSFFVTLKNLAYIDYSALKIRTKPEVPEKAKRDYSHRSAIKLPKGYLELLKQKRYSKSTSKTYSAYFKDFMHYFDERDLAELRVEEINAYLLELIDKWDITTSEQNQRINAIKFFYEKVLGWKRQSY